MKYFNHRWRLRPRLLRGISDVDLSTTVLGQTVSMPICVAPTGSQKLAHPDGEIATAKGNTRNPYEGYISSDSTQEFPPPPKKNKNKRINK